MTLSFSCSSDEDEVVFPDLKELLHSLSSKAELSSHTQIRPSALEKVGETLEDNRTVQKDEWIVYDSEDDSFFAAPSTGELEFFCKPATSHGASAKAGSTKSCLSLHDEQNSTTKSLIMSMSLPETTDGYAIQTHEAIESNTVHQAGNELLNAKDQCDFGISLQVVEFQSTPSSSSCVSSTKHGRLHDTSPTSRSSSVYYSCASDVEESQSNDSNVDDTCRQISIGKRRPRVRRRIICESDSESETCSSSGSSFEKAILSYSPPRRSRPQVVKLPDTTLIPATPSSRTSKHRIPRSPHRESNVRFWDEEESTAWVEMHKPKATPMRTPLKTSLPSGLLNSIDFRAPQTPKTPKKSIEELNHAREAKQFIATRETLARAFLNDFSTKVCPELESLLSGPIDIVWSKTLASTAGRATYSKSQMSARIELSIKVIDCLARLQSTLAHEMCHIMVWAINGQFTNPHGKEFKAFGRRVKRLLGIEVDTTHNYKINYKYQWQCTNSDCVKVYGRHSKSLDPTKVVCGTCHSKLAQILPKPRMNATPRKVPDGMAHSSQARFDGLGRYQVFLKANIDRIRASNPGLKYAELIKIVALEYAVEKAKHASSVATTTSSMANGSMNELESLVSRIEL